jgi:phytoene/squalene synthetase
VRERLVAIYAVNYEIARTAETVSEGALGDIRLEWWREALSEIRDGKPARSHPALVAFATAHRQTPFSWSVIDAMITARRLDLEAQPFATRLEFDDYIAATAGGAMRLAIEACGRSLADETVDRFVFCAGWLWGVTGLLRAESVWRMRGRSLLPHEGLERLTEDALGAYREMRTAPQLSSALFPAVGYATLAPGYLRALKQGRTRMPLLARQFKLIAASATGRI